MRAYCKGYLSSGIIKQKKMKIFCRMLTHLSAKRQRKKSFKITIWFQRIYNLGRIILPELLSLLRFLLRILHRLILFCLWNTGSCSSFHSSRITHVIFLIMNFTHICNLFSSRLVHLLNYSDSQPRATI